MPILFLIIFVAACRTQVNQVFKVNFYDDNTLISSVEVKQNETTSLPEYHKEGFTNKGFFTRDGQEFTSSTKVISNLDLYVKLEAITHTITYHNTMDVVNPNPTSLYYIRQDNFEGLRCYRL